MATETKHSFVLTAKDKTANTLDSVGIKFSSLGDKANAATSVAKIGLGTVATAAAATTAAMTALTVASFDSLDTLGKFADRIGISTEALTSLRYAASQTAGVTDDQLDTALQRMVRRVSQAAEGTGEAVKVLDELNLSATELNQLSPDQQFAAIADAMSEVGDQGDKVRLTFGLFDSEGVGLVNTLNQGSEGLARFAAEAEAMGITMDRSAITKVEAANDAMDNMKRSTAAIGNELAVNFAPIVTGMANLWVENVAKTVDWGKVAQNVVDYSVAGFAMVADGIQNVRIALLAAKVGLYTVADVAGDMFGALVEGGAAFMNFFSTGLASMVNGALEMVGKLGEALALLPGKAGDAGDNLVAKIDSMQASITESLSVDGSGVAAAINDFVSFGDLEGALQDLDEAITAGSWSDKIFQLHADWQYSATETSAAVKNIIADAYTPLDPENNEEGTNTATAAGEAAQEQLVSRLTTRLETVTSFLATEEEAINSAYANRQSILEQNLENGLLTEERYSRLTQKLEKAKQSELTGLAEKGATDREKFSKLSYANQTAQVVSFLETNTSALASESKTWFKINQGLSIANAFINTCEAVTKTLASYPAPINFGLAAVVAANGAAQIAAIKSQSFDSASASGTSSSTSISSSSYSDTTTDYDTDYDDDYSSDYGSTDTSGYAVTVQIIGDVVGFDQDELVTELQDQISDNINSGDMTIIEAGSRQAALIRGDAA